VSPGVIFRLNAAFPELTKLKQLQKKKISCQVKILDATSQATLVDLILVDEIGERIKSKA
jgi:hypothetical protein